MSHIIFHKQYNWAVKIKAIFNVHGLWEAIEPEEGKVVDLKKNNMEIAYLYQALPEGVVLQVAQYTQATETWEAIKIKDEETIDDFPGKLNGLVSKAVTLGATIAESDMVRKLLDSMPDRFIQIVATIEQCYDVDNMKLEEAIERLKAYEERIKGKDDSSMKDSKLLFTRSQGKYKQQGGHRHKQ
ncbi:uncharacterized protein LOC143546890 [Bidens hawaiensis]|uniref:uncharacterized protein LOC143546890 n=1 Tax=Bidens hawaiensis TaxID=980011 RepID=UPI00404AD387